VSSNPFACGLPKRTTLFLGSRSDCEAKESGTKMNYAVFNTAFGWCSFVGSQKRIAMCAFGQTHQTTAFERIAEFAGAYDIELADHVKMDHPFLVMVRRYTSGEHESFAGITIFDDHMTDFQKRVVRTCRRIRYGKTLSYGEVATRAGSPRAARAVGTVMRNNRTPLLVPCHRVVASGGVGGYSAANGVSMKKRLLALEGVLERTVC
jgi:methylated-DNA-[protein]-cysteine S-methyltransferase